MVKVSLKINSSPCEIKFSLPWKIFWTVKCQHFLAMIAFLPWCTVFEQQYKFTYNRIVHRCSFNICEIYICLFTPHGNYCLRDNISNRRYRRYAIKEFKMATKLSSGSCKEARDFEKYFDSLRLYWIENGIPSFCDKRYLNTIQRIKKHSINV